MIRFSNPFAQNKPLQKEINNAFKRVFNSNKYLISNELSIFEKKFANYIGTKYSVGVANGTDAIELTLRSMNIGKNDYIFF